MTDEEKVKKIKKIVNDNYEEAKQDIIKGKRIERQLNRRPGVQQHSRLFTHAHPAGNIIS